MKIVERMIVSGITDILIITGRSSMRSKTFQTDFLYKPDSVLEKSSFQVMISPRAPTLPLIVSGGALRCPGII
jgi:hypothetical protein